MAITSLPTPPSRSDPENFPERADAFMAALPRFATEANALQEHVNEAAATVDQDSTAAALSRDAAAESRNQAGQSAQAAEAARQTAAQKAGEASASAQLAQKWAEKMGAPVEGDGFSAKHYAQLAAIGAGLPVYMPGSVPSQSVGPIYIVGQGNAEWDAATGRYRVHSDIPIGAVSWWPLRSSIPAGRIPADGQTISRATFPDLAAMVVAGTVPIATESDWLADPRNRGCYTLGDGSTTIRVPDLNGRSTGSLGRVFLSGDGTDSNGAWGVIQRDQFQKHQHYINIKTGSSGSTGFGTSAFGSGVDSQYSTVNDAIRFDSAVGDPRTGNKTHPQNVTGVWTIQAFGAVTNPGAADAAQLASDYAALNAAVQANEGRLTRAFGIDQSWTVYSTSERVLGATYTNTTGRPIIVAASLNNATANAYVGLQVRGWDIHMARSLSSPELIGASAVVPAGSTYRVRASTTDLYWQEYR
ncbi:phage tail protein [Achromobacter xylosoxidans]|uniref:phage tail protein n=1 Tax=Alcaligenes xylosoxydans xylosoxydans TaxID=85698 RepID=UPI001F1440FB|nr:phage tail protein [Achromobacter xylosoxidans]